MFGQQGHLVHRLSRTMYEQEKTHMQFASTNLSTKTQEAIN